MAGHNSILVVAASPHGYGHFYRGNLVCEFLLGCGFEVFFLTNNTNGSPIVTFPHHAEITVDMESGETSDSSKDFLIEFMRVHSFDFVIFDHFPLGKLALVNVFDLIRLHSSTHTKFFCIFRDIFSDIDDIIPWSLKVLNRRFDKLLVFSDPNYLQLPSFLTNSITVPVEYLGYLDSHPPRQVTVFGGGGKYNFDFYQQTLEVIQSLELNRRFEVKLITGTVLPDDNYHSLHNRFKHISVDRFCEDMEKEISKSAITISTLGYNTFVQLLKYNNHNIIVPMLRNEAEQSMRGELLVGCKPGVCSVIHFSDHYQEKLACELTKIINNQLNMSGLWNLKKQLIE